MIPATRSTCRHCCGPRLHPRQMLRRWPITEKRKYRDLIANIAFTTAVVLVFTRQKWSRPANRGPLVPNRVSSSSRDLPHIINTPILEAENQDLFEAEVRCYIWFQATSYPGTPADKKDTHSCLSSLPPIEIAYVESLLNLPSLVLAGYRWEMSDDLDLDLLCCFTWPLYAELYTWVVDYW